jgi:hypothetical protein
MELIVAFVKIWLYKVQMIAIFFTDKRPASVPIDLPER